MGTEQKNISIRPQFTTQINLFFKESTTIPQTKNSTENNKLISKIIIPILKTQGIENQKIYVTRRNKEIAQRKVQNLNPFLIITLVLKSKLFIILLILFFISIT